MRVTDYDLDKVEEGDKIIIDNADITDSHDNFEGIDSVSSEYEVLESTKFSYGKEKSKREHGLKLTKTSGKSFGTEVPSSETIFMYPADVKDKYNFRLIFQDEKKRIMRVGLHEFELVK